MRQNLFERFKHNYILVVMILSRLFGSVGGLLVIYYVELALIMPAAVRMHFRISSLVVVVVACTLTVLLALWETRKTRMVLKRHFSDEPVAEEDLSEATREAMTFVGQHHFYEAWLVPCTTLLPVLVVLKVLDDASISVMGNITLTVFMGISLALMSTFFAVEHWMQPVTRFLLDQGAEVDYAAVPAGRLRLRFGLCSTLIIVITALMISVLARQRAADIMDFSVNRREAVDNLMAHSMYITVAAVITGVVFSKVLSHSVVSRVGSLVQAMENVGRGSLSERLQPTGNDEIDRAARQFNTMVQKLEYSHHTIQDLNANLEYKVQQRTSELEDAMQKLYETQSQLTDAARQAGMAEIATGVLHNVGNVLNSVNVSTNCLKERTRKSSLGDLARFTDQLTAYRGQALEFLQHDGRAEKVLDYLTKINQKLSAEQSGVLEEVQGLTEKVNHIKSIINTQQTYARRVRFRERVDVVVMVQDIIEMHLQAIQSHGLELDLAFHDHPSAMLEKSHLAQVLDNLIKNAVEAIGEAAGGPRRLQLCVEQPEENLIRIRVTDTGCGIAAEDLQTVFTYGFTTKRKGNGFGLHSSALAMASIGGSITAHSEGRGQGATFTVEFPADADEVESAEESQDDPSAANDPVAAFA